MLVTLYEQNDKPSSAVKDFIYNFHSTKIGGPTLSEYEKLLAEMSDFQKIIIYFWHHIRKPAESLRNSKNSHPPAFCKKTADDKDKKRAGHEGAEQDLKV